MKIANTAYQMLDVQACGTYWEEYKNGEIWIYHGEDWYLSHLELSPEELRLYMELANEA